MLLLVFLPNIIIPKGILPKGILPIALVPSQGNYIGRIRVHWAIIYFEQLFENDIFHGQIMLALI
jgi:hypothetical protein